MASDPPLWGAHAEAGVLPGLAEGRGLGEGDGLGVGEAVGLAVRGGVVAAGVLVGGPALALGEMRTVSVGVHAAASKVSAKSALQV